MATIVACWASAATDAALDGRRAWDSTFTIVDTWGERLDHPGAVGRPTEHHGAHFVRQIGEVEGAAASNRGSRLSTAVDIWTSAACNSR
jgi:hypothetical protein